MSRTVFPGLVREREARRRRILLVGIAGLILLTLTPVVGRHILGAAHQPLTGIDHIGALCLVALHVLLGPVHSGLHLLVGAGVLYALWERTRATLAARRALLPLDGGPPMAGDPFWTAAQAAGLPPHRLRVVENLPTPAFTAGWFSPRVYVAKALAHGPRRLAPEELVAVLAHERAHVERRDPLRFSVLRAMASMLFWIPALRGLADDVADEAEVLADDAATERVDPLALASAIVSVAAWRAPPLGMPNGAAAELAVGFVRHDLVERRVRRLAGEETRPASRVSTRSIWSAAFALVVVWTAGVVDIHPLPHGSEGSVAHGAHCEHPRDSALSHLFCRAGASGGWITVGSSECPHRVVHSAPTLMSAPPAMSTARSGELPAHAQRLVRSPDR